MANTYEQIGTTQTVGSAVASVTFSDIPQTYTDLKVVVSARSDAAALTVVMRLLINALTSGYTDKYLYGSGSAAGSGSYGATNGFLGDINAANSTASTFASTDVYIPNYTSANAKSWSVDDVSETNATTIYMELTAGLNSTTAAITSLVLNLSAGNFVTNSTFSLYGIKKN